MAQRFFCQFIRTLKPRVSVCDESCDTLAQLLLLLLLRTASERRPVDHCSHCDCHVRYRKDATAVASLSAAAAATVAAPAAASGGSRRISISTTAFWRRLLMRGFGSRGIVKLACAWRDPRRVQCTSTRSAVQTVSRPRCACGRNSTSSRCDEHWFSSPTSATLRRRVQLRRTTCSGVVDLRWHLRVHTDGEKNCLQD
jgi:hypothetical protein